MRTIAPHRRCTIYLAVLEGIFTHLFDDGLRQGLTHGDYLSQLIPRKRSCLLMHTCGMEVTVFKEDGRVGMFD